jgi:hypothetical protein
MVLLRLPRPLAGRSLPQRSNRASPAFFSQLNGLKVNGRSVTQRGEQFNDHGFNGRAWVPAGALVDGGQIFTLDWPDIKNVEQRIARATIVDALPKVTALW